VGRCRHIAIRRPLLQCDPVVQDGKDAFSEWEERLIDEVYAHPVPNSACTTNPRVGPNQASAVGPNELAILRGVRIGQDDGSAVGGGGGLRPGRQLGQRLDGVEVLGDVISGIAGGVLGPLAGGLCAGTIVAFFFCSVLMGGLVATLQYIIQKAVDRQKITLAGARNAFFVGAAVGGSLGIIFKLLPSAWRNYFISKLPGWTSRMYRAADQWLNRAQLAVFLSIWTWAEGQLLAPRK
jgi:hypothetical protein